MRIRARSKKPKKAPSDIFAIRKVGTELYWDGGKIPGRCPGWSGKAQEQLAWTPKFTETVHHWVTREDAIEALNDYELHGTDKPHPKVEIVTLSFQPAITAVEASPGLCPLIRERDRILRYYGITLSDAFGKSKIDATDAESYHFVVKRKGRSKTLMDESDIGGAVSYGVYTFLQTENDALHVRLLLGENFDKLYRIR